jgi:DNA-binding NarL/FixJ family response regulator
MKGRRRSSKARKPRRQTDVAAMLRACDSAVPPTPEQRRTMLAEFCKLIARQHGQTPTSGTSLPPRMKQTLERLLTGDSEKEIAARLSVSRNTVHTYVVKLYQHYNVSSRAELLAKFLAR